jgi:NADH dehydrogenase
VPGAAEHAFSLKTLTEGIALRNHILRNFEKASHEDNAEERRKLLTFVVVGGGATGIEFAGALAELVHGPLRKDFPALDFRDVRVLIIETADSLLPGMAGKVRYYALNRLRDMGVDIELRSGVKEVTPESVLMEDGRSVPTRTVVWTAGVKGDPKAKLWGLPLDRNGRVPVLDTLQAPGYPNVYVVGDLAAVEEDGRQLPMIAPVAIQQGTRAARNIALQLRSRAPEPFRYRDRGMMITVGRGAAVTQLGGVTVTGFPAWILWLGVHLFKLIGFRNRLMALINWSWDYFFYERVVRLILP